MAESLLLSTEDDEETTEKAGKKSRARSGSSEKLGASVLEKNAVKQAERAKMSPLDKLIASLLPEKNAKTDQNTKAAGLFTELGKPKSETNPAELLTPGRELTVDELSGGEVVIQLREEDASQSDEELADLSVVDLQAMADPEDSIDPAAPDEPIEPPPTGTSAHSSSTSTGGTPPRSGSSGGNRTPPPPPPTSSSPPPPTPPPSSPVWAAPVSAAYQHNTAASVAPPTSGNTLNQLLAQQRALEQAAYDGRRHGRVEGLLGGLIIGGLIEHFRHKSRERRMEKRARQERQKQEKQLSNLEFQLKAEQLEQARREEAERYARKAAAKQETATVAQAQMSEADAIKHAREATRSAEEQEREKAALIERLNAQATQQEQLEAENLLLDSDNRIETSAWHAIEVDKAGHAVQDTKIVYGHEYYQERGHESAPKDTVTRDSMTGATVLTAVATAQPSSGGTSGGSSALPPMLGMSQAQADAILNDRQADGSGVTASNATNTHLAGVLLLLAALTAVTILIILLT